MVRETGEEWVPMPMGTDVNTIVLHCWANSQVRQWLVEDDCKVECCEKYKSFKLKIPQPDSERRHSPDFRTVFGIMIGPFSSCEIGKTWGTNKQVNKQTNKNWKFQFPQPDYRPRHSLDFRTVFGIMIRPFSICEIGKTWGTNKQINKQTNKNWNF